MKFNKKYSIIVLYNDNQEIFIQDRRNISKYWEEWWCFWWSVEEWESFEDAVIREAKEELNIDITWNYKYIWTTIFSLVGLWTQETNIYLIKYLPEYDTDLKVFEWAWWKFVKLEEYQKMKITSWNYIAVDMLNEYFSKVEHNLILN